MDNFIDGLKNSISKKNWHASLILALTLPDICSKYSFSHSQTPYSDWFNAYLLDKYTSVVGAEHTKHVFLSGSDCYALRCSLLHEGRSVISHQRAREILEDFIFVAPPKSGLIHMNQSNQKLQLQIDIFSNDVLEACTQWWRSLEDEDRQSINEKLLQVHDKITF